ncbi:MAG TPA: nitrate/nitrite transporter [Fibrobacteria bacterium]|nr:nitrate/nitrite transporter [Fibrobacteria bacterium]
MQIKEFMKAGHPPTLFASFLYFDISFMIWVLLGPLGVAIAKDLDLDPSQKGFMVALPYLSGAFARFFMGMAVDRIGAKATGIVGQVLVIGGLSWAWIGGIHTLSQVHVLGLFLGIAGASFAVSLPLASRWYPPEAQGLAMGIAGAGNSGTVFSALFAPLLAKHLGWNAVFGVALIPALLTLLAFVWLAKDAPDQPPPKTLRQYGKVLKDKDTWWFMGFYSVTFGGFSGLAASLVIYFNAQFGVDPVHAGYLAAGCVLAGSVARPIGGRVADRFGGIRSLQTIYLVVAVSLALVAVFSQNIALTLVFFVTGMLGLGMGNGSVFQLIPQRFRKEIGLLTGLVGMAGGLGGFYLATSLGVAKQVTGTYATGFYVFVGLAVLAFLGVLGVKRRWRSTWGSPLNTTARI